jgi:hypothetical protein
MIDLFKKISGLIKPHEELGLLDIALPVLNLSGKPDLEAVNPTPPKEVVNLLILV